MDGDGADLLALLEPAHFVLAHYGQGDRKGNQGHCMTSGGDGLLWRFFVSSPLLFFFSLLFDKHDDGAINCGFAGFVFGRRERDTTTTT